MPDRIQAPKPRQAKGDGSRPRKRKDGRYVAYLTLEDGKRRYVYGRTSAECSNQLRELRVKRATGRLHGSDNQTIEQFLTWWLTEHVNGSVKPATYSTYEMYCRLHLIPGLGRRRLGQLSPQHVQSFLNERAATDLAPRTVGHLRAVLRTALNVAIAFGMITRNAAEFARPPRVPKTKITPLTPEEAVMFVEGIDGHYHEALYILALATGLRLGEVLGLQWTDLDLERGTLLCARQLDFVDGEYVLVEHKRETSSAYRTLALPEFAVAALRQHRVRQAEMRLKLGDAWHHEWNLVFPREDGYPLHEARPTRELHKVLRRLGLPDQRFHDLRHSAAALMRAQGATLEEVSEQLGHSGISITSDYYGHLYPEVKRKNADRMNDLFTRQSGQAT